MTVLIIHPARAVSQATRAVVREAWRLFQLGLLHAYGAVATVVPR